LNRIGLEGVAAPELDQTGGNEAKQKLENLILDKDIIYMRKKSSKGQFRERRETKKNFSGVS
jgi:endonuclease YncB( thermonuclease family)